MVLLALNLLIGNCLYCPNLAVVNNESFVFMPGIIRTSTKMNQASDNDSSDQIDDNSDDTDIDDTDEAKKPNEIVMVGCKKGANKKQPNKTEEADNAKEAETIDVSAQDHQAKKKENTPDYVLLDALALNIQSDRIQNPYAAVGIINSLK